MMIKSVRDDVAALGHCRDNLSLLFNRMCPGIDEPAREEREQKKDVLSTMTRGYTEPGYIDLYKYALKQWRRTMEQDTDVVCFEMEVVSAMIVGKGDQNVHEFGITLQLPWGTPVIPGSAIKGVLSTFAHEQGGEEWQKSGLKKYSGDHSRIMFGGLTEEQDGFGGALDFYDAWWLPSAENKPFDEDIITAHNAGYYKNGKSWPHGMDDPNPVPFIVVKPGEKFFFAGRGNESWRNLAREMLINAAELYGFGAKTRVGYGRLQYVKSVADWIHMLPVLEDSEIATLYKKPHTGAELRKAIVREVQSRNYSPALKKILQVVSPEVCMLADIKERSPKTFKDVKKIYDTYKRRLKENGVSPQNPVVQEIFAQCVSLAPSPLSPWFAAFAPAAGDLVRNKTGDEIDKLLLRVSEQGWPPIADFEAAIKETALDEDDKELCLMTLNELMGNR